MKIVVSGGCGFIGTNIAIEAINRGYEVVAFDNLSRKGVEGNLKYMEKTYPDQYGFIWGDVRKQGDFKRLPHDIDGYIHMAANPSVVKSIDDPTWDFESNAVGTLNALRYVKALENLNDKKVSFIYASTNKTFSDISNKIPMVEKETRFEWDSESWPRPGVDYNEIVKNAESINEEFTIDGYGKYGHSLYGISKLSGELLCQEFHIQFGIPMVIFKMSCIFGLYQMGAEEQAWVDWFLKRILKDEPITLFGTGKQVRDVLDGRDTARAYLDAFENIDKVNGEIFTLGGGKDNTYSLIEAIREIEKITGKKAKIKYSEKRPSDQDIYISSISKIKRMLDWQPEIKFQQTIKDMIREYGH